MVEWVQTVDNLYKCASLKSFFDGWSKERDELGRAVRPCVFLAGGATAATRISYIARRNVALAQRAEAALKARAAESAALQTMKRQCECWSCPRAPRYY